MPVAAIVDADILVYQAACISESKVKGDDEEEFPFGPVVDPRRMASVITFDVEKIQARLGARVLVMALSDYEHPHWRKRVYPQYKHNRKGSRPALFEEARRWITDKYLAVTLPALEGDDVLGLLATRPDLLEWVTGERGLSPVMVSVDKDLNGVPGRLLNPAHSRRIVETDEHQAAVWHAFQTLCGDSVDGYPGCPGVGVKRAWRALSGATDAAAAWKAVVKTYEARGLSESHALAQARVARILQGHEYEPEERRINLWNPPPLSGTSATSAL